MLPNRPITARPKKRSRTEAQLYQNTNHFQPRLEDLQVGELCIMLAPDASMGDTMPAHTDELSFRIQLDGRGKYSRLLYLAVVERVDMAARQVTWVYLGPRRMTDKTERKMAKQKAEDPKNWLFVDISQQTSDWDPDEMIINWVKGPRAKGWCIPEAQYDDTKKVLTAMEELTNTEKE